MVDLQKAVNDNEENIRNGYFGSLAIGIVETEPQTIHLYVYGKGKHKFLKQLEVDGEVIPIKVHYDCKPKPA